MFSAAHPQSWVHAAYENALFLVCPSSITVQVVRDQVGKVFICKTTVEDLMVWVRQSVLLPKPPQCLRGALEWHAQNLLNVASLCN